uniref:hypothetical protein n=1 Tax=Chryseobacterium sp. TaxID=1871047 RepID=UPI0025C3EB33
MKNTLILCVLSLLWIGCKKEGNKDVLKADDNAVINNYNKSDSIPANSSSIKTNEKTNFVYKATDGSLVKVVFNNSPKENTVTITSNKKTIVLTKEQS